MKKLFALVLILTLLGAVACADIDLSGMSYDELVALKDQINLAIWQSDEWQEVTVPQGTWIVGEDIPAGTWTVKCADDYRWCIISWGDKLTSNGEMIAYEGRYSQRNAVYNPNHAMYKAGDGLTEYSFSVTDGQFIILDNSCGAAVFTPYSGKPSLGFK